MIASNATGIDPSFNMSEVFSVVTDQLKQNFRSPLFRQTMLPVIGEFLFYAATQEESEARLIQAWEPQGVYLSVVIIFHFDGISARVVYPDIPPFLTSTRVYRRSFCIEYLKSIEITHVHRVSSSHFH